MSKAHDFLSQHPLLRQLLMMLVISLVAIIIVFIVLKIYARVGQEYPMYDLVGDNIEEISDTNALGLEYVVIDSIFDNTQRGGTILSQDPKAGALIKKGRKVYVSIASYHEEEAVMPDLKDMSVKQAVSTLNNMGFGIGRLKFVTSQFSGAVLEQTYKGRVIQPGDPLARGSKIDLTVGITPEKSSAIVPFIIGKSPEKAHYSIHSGGFNVGGEHFDGVGDRSKAVVVRQSPDYTGLQRYPLGTSVELWYSDGSTIDVDKLVNDFKVDSSQIFDTPIDDNSDDDIWAW
ncbi:MAG: PASTA domain-containing protein [Bacteroidales bacterium]|nr:PASTA domain-containing protein [Bacteroidales bacterium]